MYDTIIIGAGMSGLAAGIRLAHYDQRVCILEKHWTIGGLNSFYRAGGRNYDVGLHAVTNFTPPGTKKGPLARLLRQLRFKWEDFELSPTSRFGDRLSRTCGWASTNDIELLKSEIASVFPRERDNFEVCCRQLADYDDLNQENFGGSAREFLGSNSSRSAADRDAPLPVDVVRKCSRKRHGLRAILHHVSQHLSGRFCPALQGRTVDPQAFGTAFPGAWAVS